MPLSTRTLASPLPDDEDAGEISLTRAIQVLGQLEDGFQSLFGRGVVYGVLITKVSTYVLRVPSGSIFYQDGYLYTLAANQDYTAAVASNTVYVYGKIVVTRAAVDAPTAQDTYVLTLTHNTTGTTPTDYFPLAVLKTDGAGILSIDNGPEGKYVKAPAPLRTHKLEIATGTGFVIAAAEQVSVWRLKVSGSLKINGLLRIGG